MSSSASNEHRKLELELEFRKEEMRNTHEFNLKGMEAQNNFKQHEMRNRFRVFYWVLGCSLAAFVVVITLVIACVAYGKESFALDFFKSVVIPIFTGVGGYLAGRQRTNLASSKPSVVLEERND